MERLEQITLQQVKHLLAEGKIRILNENRINYQWNLGRPSKYWVGETRTNRPDDIIYQNAPAEATHYYEGPLETVKSERFDGIEIARLSIFPVKYYQKLKGGVEK